MQIDDGSYRGAMERLTSAADWCRLLRLRHPDEMSVWKIEENVLRAIELLKEEDADAA